MRLGVVISGIDLMLRWQERLSFASQMIESFFEKINTELLHNRTWKHYD
jgi:hypothetical protein